MKKASGFNTPFNKLNTISIKEPAETPAPPPVSQPKEPEPVRISEAELFSQAMHGVSPMKNNRIPQESTDINTLVETVRHHKHAQDREVVDELNALIKGRRAFDISSTGEYVEGHVVSLPAGIMGRLKKGEFALQGHVDLHGHTREEARRSLETFIHNAVAMDLRCLLVIHGRGLKSPGGPVLKDAVITWLTTGSLSHHILALCSARPCDGGAGAMYVLLRKRPEKSKWKKMP